jgi:putative ABC transport system substrate-binding protein
MAAEALGLQLRLLDVDSPEDIALAIEATRSWPADGLVVLADARLTTMLPAVIDVASRNRLPTIYPNANDVRAGGLMAYGDSQLERYRRAAYFVDKILRGARPADLPVERPTSFEFLVNLKAAQALGLRFPHEVAAQVTEWVP